MRQIEREKVKRILCIENMLLKSIENIQMLDFQKDCRRMQLAQATEIVLNSSFGFDILHTTCSPLTGQRSYLSLKLVKLLYS